MRGARWQERFGTAAKQLRHILLSFDDAPHDAAQPLDFRGVQLQRPMRIREGEGIDDDVAAHSKTPRLSEC